jgi:uncharacterized membrane protein YbhN (UPF0104 family)
MITLTARDVHPARRTRKLRGLGVEGDGGLRMSALAATIRTAAAGGSPRRIAAVAIAWIVVVAGLGIWMLNGHFRAIVPLLQRADRTSAVVAAACFATSLAATAGAWRAAFGTAGARLGRVDAFSRYGAGSLVNTFVPARLGDGVRLALFTRTLPCAKWRVLAAGSSVAAVTAAALPARLVLLGALVALGFIPLWPLIALGGVLAGVLVATIALRRRVPKIFPAALRDSVITLTRSPGLALRLMGWMTLEAATRVAAAGAVAAALGVGHPLTTALLITAAVDLASAVPVTPGNVGITSGAIALALHSHGASVSTAVAAGVAYHAIQTAVGVTVGVASVARLAAPTRRGLPAPGVRTAVARAGFLRGRVAVVPAIVTGRDSG